MLSAFGLKGNAIDPAGLLAVGSRYENEIAAAACIAATGQGWIAAIAIAQKAFRQAEVSLSPKVDSNPFVAGRFVAAQTAEGSQSQIRHCFFGHPPEVAAFVEQYQLREISWYCGAAPACLPKTHPDLLQIACEAMAVDPAATLVIGDSAADLALARQGAAGFLGMTGGWQQAPQLDSLDLAVTRIGTG